MENKELILEQKSIEFTKELKEMLIKTQNLVLKEKSWWDSYWGTGRNGKGKNRMGYLLSIVRNELQEIK